MRVAMVTLLLSVAALVVVFVLLLRKQKRMYVAQLEELHKLYNNSLSELSRLTNEVFKSDTKAAKLSTDLNLANQEVAMLTEQRDIALATARQQVHESDAKVIALSEKLNSEWEKTTHLSYEITNLTSHRNQLQEANKQLEERCNMYVNMVAERDKEIEKATQNTFSMVDKVDELSKKLHHTSELHARCIGELQKSKAEISGLKKQIAVQKGVITKLRKKLNAKEVPGE